MKLSSTLLLAILIAGTVITSFVLTFQSMPAPAPAPTPTPAPTRRTREYVRDSLVGGDTEKLTITNGCDKGPMWIDYIAPQTLWQQNVRLQPGQSVLYPVPVGGIPATRFWPKYDCDEKGENCRIGESGGPNLPCPKEGCAPPVDSKFEATFQGPGQDDYFDTSQVDGYTLPYKFEFWCAENHTIIDCHNLTSKECPQAETIQGETQTYSLEVENPEYPGKYAGCYSPCGLLTYRNWNNPYAKYAPDQYPAYQYCCAGPYNTAAACNAGPVVSTQYTQVIHKYCPGVYAWAYDDGTGLYHCPSETTRFHVTFYCPDD